MSELLVNTIKKADGTGSLSVPAESGTVVTTASPSLGRRNLIINGAMQVAQRGTSFSISGGTDQYTLDRWYQGINNSGSWTDSQSTDVPTGQGFKYSWKADCTATGTADQMRLIYKIEGYDTNQLSYGASGAKTVTLSFWIKSNKTGSAALSIETYGGTSNRYYNTAYTISSADTWEYKTITISGDTASGLNADNTLSYLISWWFSAGSSLVNSQTALNDWTTDGTYATIANGQSFDLADNTANYVNITGVQLEVGSVATPFEHRSYGEELALCKRYYQQLNSNSGNEGHVATASCLSSRAYAVYRFETELRASPTITATSGAFSIYDTVAGTPRTGLSIDEFYQSYTESTRFRTTTATMTNGASTWLAFASAGKITIDAEL